MVKVRGLSVQFPGENKPALERVGFDLNAGERLAIVGESGAGKTMVGLSLLALLPPAAHSQAETLRVAGFDVNALTPRERNAFRGRHAAMIFQNPMTSFNPVRTLGHQMQLALARHQKLSTKESEERVEQALRAVGLPDPQQKSGAYPHQLSGGQLQRAMIAVAMLNEPTMLVADEPTTALDTTVQAQILDLLAERMEGRSLLLITHDLAVAATLCERVMVLREGQVVETGLTREVLKAPQHDYTKALIAAAPGKRGRDERPQPAAPLLSVTDCKFAYPGKRPTPVLHGVSFDVAPGETLALVGESGSGKTTLAMVTIGALPIGEGQILFKGVNPGETRDGWRQARRHMQLVLQDPYASLDPRWRIRDIIAEPLDAYDIGSRAERTKKVEDLLATVELDPALSRRRPDQLSGGQRQRVAIARALALAPELILADEPVSALDLSVQDQILRLLHRLQRDTGLALLFVSHDLGVVTDIADRVLVLYLGRVMETGPTREVLGQPLHPYTAALAAAAPTLTDAGKPRLHAALAGETPGPHDIVAGCAFAGRCPRVQARCQTEAPQLTAPDGHRGRQLACHYPLEP